MRKKKELNEHTKNVQAHVCAGYFGLIPFAVFSAYEGFFYEGWLSFLLAIPLCYTMCAFVYLLFSDAFYHFNYEKRNTSDGRDLSWFVIVLEIIAAIGISYLVIAVLVSKM